MVFRPETARWLLPRFGLNEQLRTRMRNLPILDELNNCDIGIVPTAWQKQQFPKVPPKAKCNIRWNRRRIFKADPSIDKQTITLEGEELKAHLQLLPGDLY